MFPKLMWLADTHSVHITDFFFFPPSLWLGGNANVLYACLRSLIPHKLKGENLTLENSASVSGKNCSSRLYIISLQYCLIVQLAYRDGEPHTTLSLPATLPMHILYNPHYWALSASSGLLYSFGGFPKIKSQICHIFKVLPRPMLLCHAKVT